jgi:hypothetical protein
MTFRLNLPRFLLACAVGVSVQLMVSCLETLIFGDVIQTASADGERNVARAEHGGRACEAAKRRALEIAPELLSLADWPLDDHLPAECMSVPDGSVAAIDDALPEAIEIADVPPIVSVVAAVFGEDVPVAKRSSSQSSPADQNRYPLGQQLAALDTQSLDDVRGGFDMNGISFTIGIERAVYINGNLVATNVLNIKDLQSTVGRASMTSALPVNSATTATGVQNGTTNKVAPQVQASQNSQQVSSGSLGVIQNGPGNYVASQVVQNPAATVIQNSLNYQTIQNVTTINASVNSIQMTRAMSVQSAIQYGIVSSLRR